jgi:hypothetical protein
MRRTSNWESGSRKYDTNSINTARFWENRDYRVGPDEHYQQALDAQPNCIHCVWYREERRRSWRVKRTEFCMINSPWWANAHECSFYRVRTFPHANSGWDEGSTRA